MNNVTFVSYSPLSDKVSIAKKARFIIANCMSSFSIGVKKEGQFYLQTWHGTTIKKLGLDIDISSNRTQDLRIIHRVFSMEGKKETGSFLSTSEYMDKKLCSIFGVKDNKLLKIGYGNDKLVNDINIEKEKAVDIKFGLDESKPTLLYAPTFRDGREKNNVVEKLLYDKGFLTEIGERANLIYRGHYYQSYDCDDVYLIYLDIRILIYFLFQTCC